MTDKLLTGEQNGHGIITDSLDDSATADQKPFNNDIDLQDGMQLTADQTIPISSSNRTQLLVIAGAVNSGKTTFLSSIFHSFQRGPFSGFLFAGSQTLVAFDLLCHMARTSSGRTFMDTERTKRSADRSFLHLKLRNDQLNKPAKDVLFYDISGEKWESAKDSIDDCRQLSIVKRADHFILLIDGERITKRDQRQRAKNENGMLLRSLLDAGNLSSKSLVDILFTKWDIVYSDNERDEHIKFISDIESHIHERNAHRLGRIRFFKIAARPINDPFKLGHGISAAFPSWVNDTPNSLFPVNPHLNRLAVSTEFDMFLYRCMPTMHFKD